MVCFDVRQSFQIVLSVFAFSWTELVNLPVCSGQCKQVSGVVVLPAGSNHIPGLCHSQPYVPLTFYCIEPHGSSEQPLCPYPFLFFCLSPPREVEILMCRYLQGFGPVKRFMEDKSLRSLETQETAEQTNVLTHVLLHPWRSSFYLLTSPDFTDSVTLIWGPLFRADLKRSVVVFQLLSSEQWLE